MNQKKDSGTMYPIDLSAVAVPYDPQYIYDSNDITTENQTYDTGLDQLMLQQQEIIRSRIDMLTSEIYTRHKLRETNLYEIDINQCTCRNLIYIMGEGDRLDRNRIELERKIIDLDQEKRKEKANCFRDVLFLQKELRYALVEKLEDEQKARMFMDPAEGLV